MTRENRFDLSERSDRRLDMILLSRVTGYRTARCCNTPDSVLVLMLAHFFSSSFSSISTCQRLSERLYQCCPLMFDRVSVRSQRGNEELSFYPCCDV